MDNQQVKQKNYPYCYLNTLSAQMRPIMVFTSVIAPFQTISNASSSFVGMISINSSESNF